MKLGFDCHVHIYPCFNLDRFFKFAFLNLTRTFSKAEIIGLILTERFDCSYFQQLLSHKLSSTNYSISQTSQGDAITATDKTTGKSLIIIPGRQINTKEKLELLALTKDLKIPDGLPAKDAISQINQAGAIAVLNWAPGKWSFHRGKLAKELLKDFPNDQLLLGESSLRPNCFPAHPLFRSGRKTIWGSDPFPLMHQEKIVGTLGIEITTETFDAQQPAQEVRRLLKSSNQTWDRVGNSEPIQNIAVKLLRNQIGRSWI